MPTTTSTLRPYLSPSARSYLSRLLRLLRTADESGFASVLRSRLRDAIASVGCPEVDSFDISSALYYIGVNYHSGQWSCGYLLSCATEYRPSDLAEREPDNLAADLYDALVADGFPALL